MYPTNSTKENESPAEEAKEIPGKAAPKTAKKPMKPLAHSAMMKGVKRALMKE